MNFELGSFENRMQEKCLLYILVVIGCARDNEDSSKCIFSKAHPYMQHICRFQQLWNNINNINNLIFMDPCIAVWISRNNQQDATL
jgi:hypothetical protein